MSIASRRRFAPAAVALAFASLLAAPCRADLLLAADTVTSGPGGGGFLEISLTNTSASDLTLSGFSVALAIAPPDVTLTGVDSQTTAPYVFGADGTGSLTFDPFPNQGFILSDLSLSADGFATLASGQTYGLGRIRFEVAADAAFGLRGLNFVPGASTQFVDANQAVYPDDGLVFQAGGVAAVPEPSSAGLLLAALGIVVASASRTSPASRIGRLARQPMTLRAPGK